MDRATVNGVELEFAVIGSGEPVLLIDPVLPDGTLPLVSEPSLSGYQLIRYHKRGWVGSTHTAGPVSVTEHAADAAALLEHLGVRRAHIVGHSSGASVGAQMALNHRDAVHSLTLLEMTLLSVPSGEAFFAQATPALEAYASGDYAGAVAKFMSVVSGFDWEMCNMVMEAHIPGIVSAAVKDADTFFGVELPGLMAWTFGPAEAAALNRPVLSIVGANTQPLWVDVAAFLRTSLPYVTEQKIHGIGHLLQIEKPAPVAEAIAEFLARNPLQ